MNKGSSKTLVKVDSSDYVQTQNVRVCSRVRSAPDETLTGRAPLFFMHKQVTSQVGGVDSDLLPGCADCRRGMRTRSE